MNKMKIMDRVFFALSVPKCVCCKQRLTFGENSLCRKCSAIFEEFKSRNCSKCARLLHKCDCSTDFLEAHYIRRVIKCYRYLDRDEASPGNSLIYSLKRDNRSDVLNRCADELVEAIRSSVDDPENYLFTNVPRRKSAIIEYGIDHSALLSREVAKRLGAQYMPLLRSMPRSHRSPLSAPTE